MRLQLSNEGTADTMPRTCALWDTGRRAQNKVSHSNETDGNLTFKLYIISIFVCWFFFVLFFLLYSSYIMRKINWIMLQ